MKFLVVLLAALLPAFASAQPCSSWGPRPPARSGGIEVINYPPPNAQQSPPQQFTGATAASVLVHNVTGRNCGSGTCVGNVPLDERYRKDGHNFMALIITNRHVAQAVGNHINVIFPGTNGRRLGAAVLQVADRADLALVGTFVATEAPVVPVATADPPVGTSVTQVGYPHGRGPNFRQGRITTYNKWVRDTGVSIAEVSFVPEDGDSGSGVFHAGQLVAVVWGGDNRDGCSVRATDVQSFLQTCVWWKPRQQQPAQPQYPQPIQPPAEVNVPPTTPAVPPAVDPGVLSRLDKLQTAVDEVRARPLPKDGVNGKDGEPGPAGKDGRDGKDADTVALQAEIDALRNHVKKLEGKLDGMSGQVQFQLIPK
jgi:hypothetical protein